MLYNTRVAERREKPHILRSDRLLNWSVLRFVPQWMTPNKITVVRFICVPGVAFPLLSHSDLWGGILFAFAAFTDALDGARARVEDEVTSWGKVADPLADKLLIGTVAVILVVHYIGVWVAGAVIGIDLILVVRALFMLSQKKKVEANRAGKAKMLFQSVALVSLFIYIVSSIPLFLVIATYLLYVAIVFAVVSLILYASA